jgi:3'(2'), 5'-bisphosphate nucleotidase
MKDLRHLHQTAIRAAVLAGPRIMKAYRLPVQVEHKQDGSPVTSADHAANETIGLILRETGIPVISEEDKHLSYDIRESWPYCWLVDPLDGTREFIEGTDEFTVNIALIHRHEPIFGVIYAPVSDTLWAGLPGAGIFRLEQALARATQTPDFPLSFRQPGEKAIAGMQGIAVSRFHPDSQTESYVRRLEKRPGQTRRITRGSSLKFCDLAEKKIDIYPRLSSIWEWDTAAGHAIVRAAGGEIYNIAEKVPLRYNKQNLRNPGFLALSDKSRLNHFLSELSSEYGV